VKEMVGWLVSVYGVDSEDDLESMEELESKVTSALNGCSRQRLRAMKMTLHKRANVDTRVSYKDLVQVLQVSYLLTYFDRDYISTSFSQKTA